MELAEPALRRSRRLAGMEEGLARPFVGGLDAEPGVDLLDGPFRFGEAAIGGAGDVPALLGQVGAHVVVDTRDLEQRNVVDARVGVATRRIE